MYVCLTSVDTLKCFPKVAVPIYISMVNGTWKLVLLFFSSSCFTCFTSLVLSVILSLAILCRRYNGSREAAAEELHPRCLIYLILSLRSLMLILFFYFFFNLSKSYWFLLIVGYFSTDYLLLRSSSKFFISYITIFCSVISICLRIFLLSFPINSITIL